MANWVVIEQWVTLKTPLATYHHALLVIDGFKSEDDAERYADWIMTHSGESKIRSAVPVEAKRPDPRYLMSNCPEPECMLRVMHDGEHQGF